MNILALYLVGGLALLGVAALLLTRGRKRLVNGRVPIDIDFDHAKRMENKSR